MTRVRRRALTGGAGTLAADTALRRRPPGGAARWQRENFRGRPVSLLAGPALAAGAAAASRHPAAVVAGLGACAVGAYDDLAGGSDKGLRGHLSALAHGRVTSGTAKILGIGATGLLTASLVGPRSRADLLAGGALVAGTANLLNLLDLRPGRALKAGAALAVVLREPGVAGACLAALPGDLRERTMLGDAGANALGAVLGTSLITQLRPLPLRLAALAAVTGLVLASERVSFSAVIDASPTLHRIDALGRLP